MSRFVFTDKRGQNLPCRSVHPSVRQSIGNFFKCERVDSLTEGAEVLNYKQACSSPNKEFRRYRQLRLSSDSAQTQLRLSSNSAQTQHRLSSDSAQTHISSDSAQTQWCVSNTTRTIFHATTTSSWKTMKFVSRWVGMNDFSFSAPRFSVILFLVADLQHYQRLCQSVRPSVRRSVTLELKSGKTRIFAPAHPSATGSRVSGLVGHCAQKRPIFSLELCPFHSRSHFHL